MSTFGVVALSVLVGLFLALLIGAAGFLIYVGFGFRKTVASTEATLAQHREEWAATLKSLGVMLEAHRTQFDAKINLINGQQIAEAVGQLVKLTKEERIAAQRIERAASAIGRFTAEWLSRESLDESIQPLTEGIDLSTGYAATAPGEPPFVTRSRVALNDARALEEESLSVTEGHQPPTDE